MGRPVLPTQQGWEALRRVIGCNVPDIEWIAPGGMSDIECAAWCKEVDKAVVSGWNAILKEAQDLRQSWQQAAAPVIAWRTRMEAGRGVLRVLLRAWREIVDDVRAGAAKWEGRWQDAMGTPIPVQKRYICECRY